MTPGNFEKFLPRLCEYQTKFVLIGAGAAIAHGHARATYDVDIVYDRSVKNIDRIIDAIKDLQPYYRGAPPGLPFQFDRATILAGLNFTLTTTWGDIDLLGEVAGNGTYETLVARSETINLYEHEVLVVDLETLIHLKRAAGRPKDFETLAELEVLLEERNKQ